MCVCAVQMFDRRICLRSCVVLKADSCTLSCVYIVDVFVFEHIYLSIYI